MSKKLQESLSLCDRVQQIVERDEVGYLRALSQYMMEEDIKPEKLAKLLSPELKDKIRLEAEGDHMIKRSEQFKKLLGD